MTMSPRQKFHAIGWGYNHPRSVPIKTLLLHPDCPWEPAAIVHDASWMAAADGIPIMRTEDFLALAASAEPRLRACLQLQEPTERQVWMRRAREVGFDLLDEGEIIRDAARAMAAAGRQCDLGVVQLPSALEPAAAQALADLPPVDWADAHSARVFDAYLRFLQTGLLTPFERVWALESEHPLTPGKPSPIQSFVVAHRHGQAWEIARERSNFLEQVCLLAGRRWGYAFSGPDPATTRSSLALLRAAFQTLPIPLMASTCEADGRQQPLEGAELPRPDAAAHAVRIDLDEPAEWIGRLAQAGSACHILVAVGRHPAQLLQALRRLHGAPAGALRLRCRRPGPSGLELEWTRAAHA